MIGGIRSALSGLTATGRDREVITLHGHPGRVRVLDAERPPTRFESFRAALQGFLGMQKCFGFDLQHYRDKRELFETGARAFTEMLAKRLRSSCGDEHANPALWRGKLATRLVRTGRASVGEVEALVRQAKALRGQQRHFNDQIMRQVAAGRHMDAALSHAGVQANESERALLETILRMRAAQHSAYDHRVLQPDEQRVLCGEAVEVFQRFRQRADNGQALSPIQLAIETYALPPGVIDDKEWQLIERHMAEGLGLGGHSDAVQEMPSPLVLRQAWVAARKEAKKIYRRAPQERSEHKFQAPLSSSEPRQTVSQETPMGPGPSEQSYPIKPASELQAEVRQDQAPAESSGLRTLQAHKDNANNKSKFSEQNLAAIKIQRIFRQNRKRLAMLTAAETIKAQRSGKAPSKFIETRYEQPGKPSHNALTKQGSDIDKYGMINYHYRSDKIAKQEGMPRTISLFAKEPEEILGEGTFNKVSIGPRNFILRKGQAYGTPSIPISEYADLMSFAPAIGVGDAGIAHFAGNENLLMVLNQGRRVPLVAFKRAAQDLNSLNSRGISHPDIQVDNLTLLVIGGTQTVKFVDCNFMLRTDERFHDSGSFVRLVATCVQPQLRTWLSSKGLVGANQDIKQEIHQFVKTHIKQRFQNEVEEYLLYFGEKNIKLNRSAHEIFSWPS